MFWALALCFVVVFATNPRHCEPNSPYSGSCVNKYCCTNDEGDYWCTNSFNDPICCDASCSMSVCEDLWSCTQVCGYSSSSPCPNDNPSPVPTPTSAGLIYGVLIPAMVIIVVIAVIVCRVCCCARRIQNAVEPMVLAANQPTSIQTVYTTQPVVYTQTQTGYIPQPMYGQPPMYTQQPVYAQAVYPEQFVYPQPPVYTQPVYEQ